MDVEYLADHASAISVIAEWYEREWAPYYGRDGPGDAQADLAARCHRDRLPLGLVALRGGEVVGTAGLGHDPATGRDPSVIGLLVRPDQRRNGVGSALLAAADAHARRLGLERIYISTTVLGRLLDRTGWRAVETVTFLNTEQGTLFVRELYTNGPL